MAEAVNIPIILYNVPGRTACDLANETVVRLSKVSTVVGIKDATGNVARGAELIAQLPDSFAVYSGDDATALELMRHGAKGNVSVTANIAPADMAEMCRLALAGDFAGAELINERLSGLNQALFIEPNPVPVKWAMAEAGMMPAGIRLPLVQLSEAYHEEVRAAMRQAGL